MAALGIQGQKVVDVYGQFFVYTKVNHDGGSNTVSVDQSASLARVFPLDGQTAPTVTVGSASDGVLNVTLSGGGSGACYVVTWHKTAVASSKP